MKLHVRVEVETPMVPNFLRTADGTTFPVGGITDEGLREIAVDWTEALIKRAHEQREDWKKERELR